MSQQAFFITSDDLFLLDTCKNNLAQHIKNDYRSEIIRLSCFGHENIHEQLDALAMPDLFSSSKLLILTAAEGKWSDSTVTALEKLLNTISKKKYLFIIIALCQFKPSQLKTKALISLQKQCEVQNLSAPQGKQLESWIQNHAKNYKLTLEKDAISFLKDHSKGNLYACDQLLQKCVLMEMTQITPENLHRLMINSSKYTIYDLMSAMSEGSKTTLTLLDYLLSQKTPLILILWNCIHLLKSAYTASFQIHYLGLSLAKATDQLWYQQKIDAQHIVKRLSFSQIAQCLQQAYRLDKIIKGSPELESVMGLKQVIIAISQGNSL
jgi:DNA polymerase III delta subunit